MPEKCDSSFIELNRNINALSGHKYNHKKNFAKVTSNLFFFNKLLKIKTKAYDNESKGVLEEMSEFINHWQDIESGVGIMVNELIDKLLLDPECYSVIRFNQDDSENLWLILEDDNFENNLRLLSAIEDFISDNDIDINYYFFDKDQEDIVISDLSEMDVNIKEYKKDAD